MVKGDFFLNKINHGIMLGSLITVLLFTGLYIYKPISFAEISTVDGFIRYARSFGVLVPIVSFIIAAFQAVVPVIPFVILCIANGVMFGITGGILLTWAATLTGATILFWVSRLLGYDWAARHYQKTNLKKIDKMNGFPGFLLILGLRLLPYFPAPLVNIMAGVSKINYWWFFLASAIGKTPFIVGYTVLGFSLIHSKNYTLGIIVMLTFMVIPYFIVRITRKKPICREKES